MTEAGKDSTKNTSNDFELKVVEQVLIETGFEMTAMLDYADRCLRGSVEPDPNDRIG